MASYSSPYASDPFYENLRARARRRRAEEARGPTTNIVDTGVDTSGSDGPNVDVVGTNLTSALAPTTTIETPSARIEINDLDAVVGAAQPQYGVTKDYSTLLRISEGVSANTMPLLAAGVTESWSPIVQAAKSEALKVGINQTPRYLRESETVGGLRTQVSGFQSGKSYLREPTGVYREVSDDELGDYPANAILSAREAAEQNPLGYIGPDPTTPGGQIAKAGLGILNAFMPATSLMTMMFGEVLETPAGTPYATGSGLGRVVALNNYRTMWDTHGKMEAGIPGNFGMKIGNSYVTYQATDGLFGTGINGAKVVGRNINAEQFQKMYATQLGYDYRTVDFNNSKAGELNGERLQGFSDGVGGFSAATGEFVDSRGRTYTDLNRDQVQDYVNSLSYSPSQLAGALNALESKKETAKTSFFGAEYKQQTYQMAIDEVRGRMQEAEDLVAALSPEEYGLAIQQVQRQYGSRLTPEEIRAKGLIVNVLESNLSPGATKWRTVVDPVTGKVNRYNFNLEPEPESSPGPEVGTSVVGGTTYTTVSGGDGGGSDSPSPSSGRSSTSEAAASEDAYSSDPSDTYFAEGGRVRGATGMAAVDSPENEDQIGPVGFVNGRTPEETTEADTVRDDVEGSVPEGTFVINAVAVERYGSEKIRKLLTSALKEAEKQGIDISATDSTITDEDSVSVAVSEGEVLVPPVLVRIIGLQKLESINALGQEEVKERVEEYGQAETSEPVEGEAPIQASVDGGFIERQRKAPGGEISDNEWDTLVGRANRMFENPGRNARKTEKFPKEFLDALDRILNQQKGILSETDVGGGSTATQREISSGTPLTPERAQELYINFPTIRQIILAEKGRGDTQQRIQALDTAEQMLRQQIGDNVPEQNAAVSVDDVYGDTFLSFEEALDGPENNARVVSETDVERQGRRQERNRRFGERRSRRSDGGFIERQKKFDGGSLYKAIPTNIRLLGEYIAGKESPITEKDFTEKELRAMRESVDRAKARNAEHEAELRRRIENKTPFVSYKDSTGQDIYLDYRGRIVPHQMLRHMDDPEFQEEALQVLKNQLKTYENTRNRTSVRNYYVNEVANPGDLFEFIDVLNNPLYQTQTTLGEFRATDTNDGMVIDDEYNFNTRELRDMIGKDSVEFTDILKNLDTPQLAAELFARYVRPEGSREVKINIPKKSEGFVDLPPEFAN